MMHQALQDLNEECAALFFHDLGRLPTADRGAAKKKRFFKATCKTDLNRV